MGTPDKVEPELSLKKVASCLRRHVTVEFDNSASEKEDDILQLESSTHEDIDLELKPKKSKRSSSLVNLNKGISLEELLGIQRAATQPKPTINIHNNNDNGTQERLLSQGDLDETFTDTDESDLETLNGDDSQEEFKEEDSDDNEFPVVTARGYYSDSEIIASSKKNDKTK